MRIEVGVSYKFCNYHFEIDFEDLFKWVKDNYEDALKEAEIDDKELEEEIKKELYYLLFSIVDADKYDFISHFYNCLLYTEEVTL